jgi:hypothetical protein
MLLLFFFFPISHPTIAFSKAPRIQSTLSKNILPNSKFTMTDGLSPDDAAFLRDLLGPDEDEDPIFGNSNPIVPVRGIPQPTAPRISTRIPKSPFPRSNREAVKCNHLFVGGTDLADGVTLDSAEPFFCTHMFCISCDHLVIRFPDRTWRESTDYLFLRLNYPDKVKQNLVPAPRWCAYCCQCTFCAEQKIRKLSPFATSWVCRGHE